MAMGFPAGLPAPAIEGHAISAGQDAIRTEMETGAARTRRRSFSSPDRVSLAWYFSAQEFAIFRAWWDGEIHGGSAWFDFLIDDGVTGVQSLREVRFVESFEASLIAYSQWRVTVKAEIRRQRLSAFDHLNTLGLPSLDLDFAGTKSLSPVITSARQPTPSITFTRASTATYVDADGLIKTAAINAPRFDHDPVSLACKGLLIEESRTNLLIRSSELNDVSWLKTNASINQNSVYSPDGTISADKLIENAASGVQHFVYFPRSGSNETLTFSVFAKSDERTKIVLQFSNFLSHSIGAMFDLSSGTVISSSGSNADYSAAVATIRPAGGGFYRCSITASKNSVNLTNNAAIILVNGGGLASYDGDGSSGVYLWGAQLEAGSFPTSYIPTTTAAVTRAADSAVMTGVNFSSWYRSDELTVFVDRISPAYSVVDDKDLVILHDGPGNNFFSLRVVGGGTQSLDSCVRSSGATQVDSSNPACAANLVHKHAAALKANDFADSINGAAVFSDSSVAVPALNQMTIGVSGAGWFRKIQAYPKRLSNAQLQAMTV